MREYNKVHVFESTLKLLDCHIEYEVKISKLITFMTRKLVLLTRCYIPLCTCV